MSGLLAGRVWLSNLPRKLKPLAASLADIANDDGTSIYPSVGYMAWRLSSSKRFVQYGLEELRRIGVLEVVANPRGGRSLTVEYRLVETKLPVRASWRARRKSENYAPFGGNDEVEKNAGRDTKERSQRQKGRNIQPERVQASAPDPSVSASEPLVSALQETGRRGANHLQKLCKDRAFPFPKRPIDPLRSDLQGGIHWKRIENVLFDARHRPFEEQVQVAIETATTDMLLNRTAKMIGVRGTDVESAAIRKMQRGLEALSQISDFTRRVQMTRDAIGNSVISAAAELLERRGVTV